MIGEKQEIGNQGGNMMFRVIVSFFAIAILILSSVFSKVEIYNDINEYINYIGSEAKEEFKTAIKLNPATSRTRLVLALTCLEKIKNFNYR